MRTEMGKAARKRAKEKFELNESVSQTSELLSSLAKMRTKTRYHSELSIETCDGDVKKPLELSSMGNQSPPTTGGRASQDGMGQRRRNKPSSPEA